MSNLKVLLTGGTGFVGSWIAKYLLEAGYSVNLTVRDKQNSEKYAFLQDIVRKNSADLNIFEADLLIENSFDEAAKDCDFAIHSASPFILNVKNPQKNLIEPALKGTQNVLSSINKVTSIKKVVLTSSIAAIHGDNKDMHELKIKAFNEDYFNQTSSIKHQPYHYSKLLAEKEAWKIYKAQSNWELAVINPSFVMGPVLSKTSKSESITFIKNLIGGKYRLGVPDLFFNFVDVRDVAKAHILAMENNAAKGRFIIANGTKNIRELAEMIKKMYPKKYKLPLINAPKILMYFVAPFFGLTYKFISRNIGYRIEFDNSKSKLTLKLQYTDFQTSIIDMLESL